VLAANVLPGDGAPDTDHNGSGSLLMTGAGDASDCVRMHEWRLPIEGGCRWGDAVVVAAAWISVIGSAVTAIAAFGGVLLAQRATRMREGRIWERRSAVYEDLMIWVLVIDHAVNDLPQAARPGTRLSSQLSRLARCCLHQALRRASPHTGPRRSCAISAAAAGRSAPLGSGTGPRTP
jgi:hypothetical protein